MLKTRKRWVSLLVAVVMIAGLLIPFTGTANALCTYSGSALMTVSAGIGTTSQQLGNGYTVFDAATWQASAGSYVYYSLPATPAQLAYDPFLISRGGFDPFGTGAGQFDLAYDNGNNGNNGTPVIGGGSVKGNPVDPFSRNIFLVDTAAPSQWLFNVRDRRSYHLWGRMGSNRQ